MTGKVKKFNLFDVFIVFLVIVVAAAGVWYYMSSTAKKNARQVTVEYTVVIKNVLDTSMTERLGIPVAPDFEVPPVKVEVALEVGDIVTDAVLKKHLGVITNFLDKLPNEVMVNDLESGRYKLVDSPNTKSVELIIRADAVKFEGEYYVNDTKGAKVKVGQLYYVHSKHFAGEGYCTGIKEVEQGG